MKRFRLALFALVLAVTAAGCDATSITDISANDCIRPPTMGSGC